MGEGQRASNQETTHDEHPCDPEVPLQPVPQPGVPLCEQRPFRRLVLLR